MRLLTLMLAMVLPFTGAHAQYLEPEEVLLRDQGSHQGPPPSTPPAGSAQSSRGRVQFREYWNASSAAVAASSAAPVAVAPVPTHDGPSPADTELDPITARWLDRLSRQDNTAPTTPSLDDGSPNAEHSTALHAGADLAGTGPGQTVGLLVILSAGAWTMWRAGRARKWAK